MILNLAPIILNWRTKTDSLSNFYFQKKCSSYGVVRILTALF